MDIKSFLKNYLSSFNIISILLAVLFLSTSCKDEVSSETINIKLNNSETYKYPTVSGDEEGTKIIAQAKHFEVSEVIRNSETGFVAVYIYKPKTDYVGNDYVELEIRRGSDGASEPTEIKTIKINFIISN